MNYLATLTQILHTIHKAHPDVDAQRAASTLEQALECPYTIAAILDAADSIITTQQPPPLVAHYVHPTIMHPSDGPPPEPTPSTTARALNAVDVISGCYRVEGTRAIIPLNLFEHHWPTIKLALDRALAAERRQADQP